MIRSIRWASPGAFVRDRVEREPADLTRAVLLPLISRVASALSRSRVSIEETRDVPVDIDSLTQESARIVRSPRLRTTEFLRSRWLAADENDWTFAVARDRAGVLVGFGVYGRDPDPPDGIASDRGVVADLLAVDARATTALLRHAWRELRSRGCDVATFDHLDPRPWSRRAHLKAGFFPIEVGPLLPRGGLPDAPTDEPTFWHLTSGDTDAL